MDRNEFLMRKRVEHSSMGLPLLLAWAVPTWTWACWIAYGLIIAIFMRQTRLDARDPVTNTLFIVFLFIIFNPTIISVCLILINYYVMKTRGRNMHFAINVIDFIILGHIVIELFLLKN